MSGSLHFLSGGVPIRIHAEELGPASSTHPHEKRPAIILLHGSGGHVEFWTARLGQILTEARIPLYAPHYFDRTGTARADLAAITDGVHVPQWLETIDAALRFVAERPGVDPRRIVLAGISLGAFLALAFAAQLSASPDTSEHSRLRALLEISGGLVSPYTELATSHMPPTLILHGATDHIVPVTFAHELDQRLTELKVAHQTEILPNESHWFTPASLPRILFALSSFLEQHIS